MPKETYKAKMQKRESEARKMHNEKLKRKNERQKKRQQEMAKKSARAKNVRLTFAIRKIAKKLHKRKHGRMEM